jgi:hypothetical protein
LLAHGRWFYPGTPASSTTKTGRHDIVEILLKVALSTKNQINQNQSNKSCQCRNTDYWANDTNSLSSKGIDLVIGITP